MNRILVVYYSLGGRTRQIAEAVAVACGGDIEEIRETRPRRGLLGLIRAVWESLRQRAVKIEPPSANPPDYDLVVLGTPVWAGRVSPPLRSYIQANQAAFKQIALFCTEGGSGGEEVFAQIAELCGKQAVATLIVTDADFKQNAQGDKVSVFARHFANPASDKQASGSESSNPPT